MVASNSLPHPCNLYFFVLPAQEEAAALGGGTSHHLLNSSSPHSLGNGIKAKALLKDDTKFHRKWVFPTTVRNTLVCASHSGHITHNPLQTEQILFFSVFNDDYQHEESDLCGLLQSWSPLTAACCTVMWWKEGALLLHSLVLVQLQRLQLGSGSCNIRHHLSTW